MYKSIVCSGNSGDGDNGNAVSSIGWEDRLDNLLSTYFGENITSGKRKIFRDFIQNLLEGELTQEDGTDIWQY